MADNLGYTPGVGATIATDDVAGVQFQRVKLDIGGDGATVPVPGDAANGVDVDVTRSVLPTGAATEATLAGIKTGTDKIPATPASEHATAVSPHAARLTDGATFYKATTPSDTQPISAAALPLPAGAAQEHVAAASPHAVRLSTGAAFYDTPVAAQLPPALVSGRLVVDGSGVTQPVSGTMTANQGTAAAAASAWPAKISDGADTVGISTVGAAKCLKVDVVQAVGAGAQTDKAAFVEGADKFSVSGGVYNETPASDPTEDQAAAARITAKRALHVNLRTAAGAEIGTVASAVRVDPTGATAQPVTDGGGSLTVDLSATTNAGATVKTADLDTGAGTDLVTLFGLALPKSGGAVAGGTATDPVRTDPTGTTTQPVSGTLTANQGTPNATPWNENLARVGGSTVVAAAAGVQKVGIADEAGAAYGHANPLPVALVPQEQSAQWSAYYTYAAGITDQPIKTPTGGKILVVCGLIIQPTAGGLVAIYDQTNNATSQVFKGTVGTLGAITIMFATPRVFAAINNILRITTGAGAAGDVVAYGYET